MGENGSRASGLLGQPWVTLALVVACVATFVAAADNRREVEQAARDELAELARYFEPRPYLEPPPPLADFVGAKRIESLRREFQADLDTRGAPPIPDGVQRRAQAVLDQKMAAHAAHFDALTTRRLGLRRGEPSAAAIFLHAFLHEKVLHLAGSLLLLGLLGLRLEPFWGLAVFGGFALLAPVASGLLFALFPGDDSLPLVGTNGLLAALGAAYAIRFAGSWNNGTYAILCCAVLAWLVAPLWVGMGPDAGALALQSVCGAVFGATATGAIWFLGLERSAVDRARERKLTHLANPDLDRALQARAQGRLDEAYGLLMKRVREHPDDHDAARAFWDVARDYGRPRDAVPAVLRMLRNDLQSGNSDHIVRHWLELTSYEFDLDLEPALLIRIAIALRNAREPLAAAAALRGALQGAVSGDEVVIATRVAKAAHGLDPEITEQAAWRALGSVELELEERQDLEALLSELPRSPAGAPTLELETPVEDEGSESELLALPPAETEPWEDPELSPESESGTAASWLGAFDAGAPETVDRSTRPAAIDLGPSARRLEIAWVTPLELDDEGLRVDVPLLGKKRLEHARVDALSLAAVHGMSRKPVLLVDLILNWSRRDAPTLEVVRMRSDRFDPRRFAPGVSSPVEALRAFVGQLLRATGGTPLPDLQSVEGQPFAVFDDLDGYQRSVLLIEPGEEPSELDW